MIYDKTLYVWSNKFTPAEKNFTHLLVVTVESFRMSGLKTHMQKHLGNTFLCDLCPKEFKVKQFRNQHQKRHNRQKLYECTQCKKSFSQPQHLNNQMERITGCYGHKLFKCTQFELFSSSLKRHMKRVGGC